MSGWLVSLMVAAVLIPPLAEIASSLAQRQHHRGHPGGA